MTLPSTAPSRQQVHVGADAGRVAPNPPAFGLAGFRAQLGADGGAVRHPAFGAGPVGECMAME